MDARQIADALDELADLSDLSGESPFKSRAYRKAAEVLRGLREDLGALIESGRLKEMPGIGDAIFEKAGTLHKTGRHPTLEKFRAAVPPGLRDLLRLPGLGPKKVIALHKELGVASAADLAQALREGRVAGLKGFGGGMCAKLAEAVEGREKGR